MMNPEAAGVIGNLTGVGVLGFISLILQLSKLQRETPQHLDSAGGGGSEQKAPGELHAGKKLR